MSATESVAAIAVQVGDTISGPDHAACDVLRIEHGVETVTPLTGRPCIKFWCRNRADGREGYVTAGLLGVFTKIIEIPCPTEGCVYTQGHEERSGLPCRATNGAHLS